MQNLPFTQPNLNLIYPDELYLPHPGNSLDPTLLQRFRGPRLVAVDLDVL